MAIDPEKLQTLGARLDNTLARLGGAERRYADADQPRDAAGRFGSNNVSGAALTMSKSAANPNLSKQDFVSEHHAAANMHRAASAMHEAAHEATGHNAHKAAAYHHAAAARHHDRREPGPALSRATKALAASKGQIGPHDADY